MRIASFLKSQCDKLFLKIFTKLWSDSDGLCDMTKPDVFFRKRKYGCNLNVLLSKLKKKVFVQVFLLYCQCDNVNSYYLF